MDSSVVSAFGGRVRVRACGINVRNDRVLLVGHSGLVDRQLYWCPPGGGIHFGEDAHDTVKREMLEETGLKVSIGRFMFLRQYLHPPLHAIELYFETETEDSEACVTGEDPELSAENQLISEVQYMTIENIRALPPENVDPLFHSIISLDCLRDERKWPAIQKELI